MSASLPSHLALLAKLRTDVAERVRERAALIHEGCSLGSWAEADRLAYGQEAIDQRALPGMAP